MRKLACILVLVILAFNWFGYRLFTSFLEAREDNQLVFQLDLNQYEESQLVSIKVPASHLSYYNCSNTFDRVDGTVDIDGITFRYVKRRLFNDTVELLCIPDQPAITWKSARDEFFKVAYDLQVNKPSGRSASQTHLLRDITLDQYLLSDPYRLGSQFENLKLFPTYRTESVLSSCLPTDDPPPDSRA